MIRVTQFRMSPIVGIGPRTQRGRLSAMYDEPKYAHKIRKDQQVHRGSMEPQPHYKGHQGQWNSSSKPNGPTNPSCGGFGLLYWPSCLYLGVSPKREVHEPDKWEKASFPPIGMVRQQLDGVLRAPSIPKKNWFPSSSTFVLHNSEIGTSEAGSPLLLISWSCEVQKVRNHLLSY